MLHPKELLKIAIVDEDVFWCRRTMQYIEGLYQDVLPEIEIYTKGEEFLSADRFFEVVLTDVKIGEVNGFAMVQAYRTKHDGSKIVFLTDHEELARRGYLVDAFRFIPKARMKEELPEALRAVHHLKMKRQYIKLSVLERGPLVLPVADIIYAQKDGRHVRIHTRTGDYLCNLSVTKVEKMVKEYFGFFRSHRSCLINLYELDTLENFGVHMKDRSSTYLSSHKIRELRLLLKKYQFELAEGFKDIFDPKHKK